MEKRETRFASLSEDIVADILEQEGIRFTYEERLLIEDKYENGSKKGRLLYPDFHLEEHGVMVEYAGQQIGEEDKRYQERIKWKKQIYKKMGLNVIFLDKNDLWDFNNLTLNGKPRPLINKRQNVLNKIYSKIISIKNRKKLRNAELDTKASRDYKYADQVRFLD
jgi:hypothetical protein|tara:strand:- start:8652 stop:9146 length:495 start_codon:yes stop_codon:yes gene_type:complete